MQDRRNGRREPRRSAPRRKKKGNGARLLLPVLAVLILAAVFLLLRPSNSGVQVTPPPTEAPTTIPLPDNGTDDGDILPANAQLALELGQQDNELADLSEDKRVQVTDLKVTSGLDERWLNVLLLGSDERIPGHSARTDTMIICSIQLETGEVKLTSIMRDTAVTYRDIGEYSGTYRINAANYFGGEALAMRTVNECFGMNITGYVHLNFYGFQQIVQAMGGIDLDVTQAEMEEINTRIVEQAKQAYDLGMTEDAENIPYQFLEGYGENVHLDGRMALAYSRIRHVDSDYSRTERQRKVLGKLLAKIKGMGAADMLSLATVAMPYLSTNLTPDRILQIAMVVAGNGMDASEMQTFRLPVNGSYVQERRNGQEMFYDTDWSLNTGELYSFIYGI